jgi:hypothetical protein
MEISVPQLTPELREAVLANPDEPVYIADPVSGKLYLLLESGKFPGLEEEHIRNGLELARQEIARGEVSNASIAELIFKAQQQAPQK